jgi:AcrR family transcriptional regulator
MNRRRDRILEAARKLIGQRGYEQLTMRALAKAAGVTVPTIYSLIGNKDAVLGATIHDGTVHFWANARPSTNPVTVLEGIVAELLRQPSYYRPVLRVLTNGGASEAMEELDVLFLRNLTAVLESLSKRGELEPWIDCGVLAERMLSNLYGVASEWATGLLSDEALPLAASFDASIALAGVATEKSRRRFQNRARRIQKRQAEAGRSRTRVRMPRKSKDLA